MNEDMNNGTMQKKNKKALLLVLEMIIMILSIGGVTYAFYNYSRAGDVNTLRLGSMEFNSNYSRVVLENAFPIYDDELDDEDVNVMEIVLNVHGKTDYPDGIEYKASFVDVQNTVGSRNIVINTDITVSSGLGTSDDAYFTNRGSTNKIYKLFGDELVGDKTFIVGYIPTSSTATNGTVTIKVYISAEKVVLVDTYDDYVSDDYGTTSAELEGRMPIPTSEWESLIDNPISFKIQVEAREGVWVNKTLMEEIKSKLDNNSGYVYSYNDSVVNSNPTFQTQDTFYTSSDVEKKDVLYYSGASAEANSNVLFAGYCWQILRTTDNGGIKLIYNGFAQNNKCLDSRSETTWKGINGEYLDLDVRGDYFYADGFDYDLETGKFSLVNVEAEKRNWTHDDYNTFIGKYTCLEDKVTNCDNIYYIGQYSPYYYSALVEKYSIGNVSNYRQIGESSFNSGWSSVSNAGYMFNEIYQYNNGVVTDAIYGKNIKYDNVSGNYTVYNDDPTETINTTTIDEYHHYSCGTTTTCSVVKFYYVSYDNIYYYINLSGGDNEISALKKMINYKTIVSESDVNINVYDSTIKSYLENWYDKNLKEYESYIDNSAVYCNDRSLYSLAGWNKTDGTYASNWLSFKSVNIDKNLACVSKVDRFSKNNPLAELRNPIGLITEPERELVGSTYATTGASYWGLSPNVYATINANVRPVDSSGGPGYGSVNDASGVRAVITLKPETELVDGVGTKNNPYQVGPLAN